MKIKRYYRNIAIVLSLTALTAVVVVSCGGGNGGGGTTLTATQQAAASASAAQGAIAMSSSVAGAADMASGYIPPSYAPGKRDPKTGTAAIANIDPRLKDVVDKMLMQMQRPAIKTALSKAGTFSKALSAPTITSSATVSCYTGNYVVQDAMDSSGTSTTHTLTVTYNACKDNSSRNIINGSISATHTKDTVATSESATVTITNLTDTTYTDSTYTQASEIFALSGTFTNASTGNPSAAGTATARGTFSWTLVDPVNGNMVMAFNFGTGSTPITDTWTNAVSGPDTTEIHTANGNYGLTVSAAGQSITLSITLANLEDKYRTNLTNGDDEWINGSVTISWSPDLSQWGCLNGTYVFTTAALTPMHWAPADYCPSSGTVQVNNAVIEFGKPSGTMVTVSLIGGPSEVFSDCEAMGGDMCSSGGTAGSTPTAGPPAGVPVM